MNRRSFLFGLPIALFSWEAMAHSPWGQYAVYRQKHLLILSTRDDAPSYDYSKRLAKAINKTAPEAKARPARAIDLNRAYNLLRTKQFQFALLSSENIQAMRTSTGQFSGKPSVDLKTVYEFGNLEFVVVADFPEELAAVVTNAVLANLDILPDAMSPKTALNRATLHQGARSALERF